MVFRRICGWLRHKWERDGGISMSNGQGNIGAVIGAIILGIVGGVVLTALLEQLSRYRCPVCQQEIRRGISYCPNCHIALRWD